MNFLPHFPTTKFSTPAGIFSKISEKSRPEVKNRHRNSAALNLALGQPLRQLNTEAE
jgi:hypothetical protein